MYNRTHQERLISREEAAYMLGVTPQTVSNWTRNGILRVRKVGRNFRYDRQSIDSLFDSLTDVREAEQKIQRLQEEYSKVSGELRSRLAVERRALDLFPPNVHVGSELREYGIRMVSCLSKVYLSDKEGEILGMLLQGKDLADIATVFRHQKDWILKIAGRACRRLLRTKDLATIVKEHDSLQTMNRHLADVVCWQNEKIAELSYLKQNQERVERNGLTQEEIDKARILLQPIAETGLSARAKNCLKSIDIKTVRDILCYRYSELLRLRNFGRKTLTEVKDFITDAGLSWEMNAGGLLERYAIYQSNVSRFHDEEVQ